MFNRAFQQHTALFYTVSVLAALIIRATALPIVSSDMQIFYLPWYTYIVNHGGFLALGQKFSDYTPPYLYLLAAITYFRSFVPPVIGIKLMSILFDVGLALVAQEIVRLKYKSDYRPWLAFTAVLLLPTVVINSANWGQADAMYTTFLLLCVYCLAARRPLGVMIFFSIALAFKFQAIFLVPFLLVMFLTRRIPWRYIVVPPIVYVILMLPAALFGRPLIDLLTIYLQQADSLNQLSMYAPNPYAFCVASPATCTASSSVVIAFIITGIVMAGYVFFLARSRVPLDTDRLLLLALTSVMLMPFVLPRMHERYFYPADVFSLTLVFYRPRLWPLPVTIQIASLLSYTGALFGAPVTMPMLGALFNVAAVLFLLLHLFKTRAAPPDTVSSREVPALGS